MICPELVCVSTRTSTTLMTKKKKKLFFQLFWTKLDDFKEWRKHLQSSWKEYAAVNMFWVQFWRDSIWERERGGRNTNELSVQLPNNSCFTSRNIIRIVCQFHSVETKTKTKIYIYAGEQSQQVKRAKNIKICMGAGKNWIFYQKSKRKQIWPFPNWITSKTR